jgi:ABC-2 type transport system ATP-binding protein
MTATHDARGDGTRGDGTRGDGTRGDGARGDGATAAASSDLAAPSAPAAPAQAGSAQGRPSHAAHAHRPPCEVRLEKVSRWYGDVLALDAVDLVIGPGVTGLLGPNGAGKSTLIRLVLGLADPGDGSVLVGGQAVRNNLSVLARIGYVPDGDRLYEELTLRRFLVDQARQRGFTREDAASRVVEVVERVGMTNAIDRRTGAFSKGMRQRLKLAQALLHDPDVLVLDEPLTGLDPVMRRDFIRVVRELGDEGVTVLVSSHVLHEIEAMTNGIVLLHHGQVVAEGTVPHIRDLLDKYARRIRVTTCRPRELCQQLLAHDGLLAGLELVDGGVVLETLRPDRMCTLVAELAADGRVDVAGLEPLDEDLSSVFAYLVN